jgi:uncharacterized protein
MSKQGYPGLVQVPPSDRWIFRRRLLRWGFALIAVTWGASAITAWLSPSDHNRDCQTGLGPEASPDLQKKCGQPGESVAEAQSVPPQSKSLVAAVSPKTSPAEPHRSKPMPTSDTDRPATQPGTDQTSIAKRPSPMNNAVVPTAERPSVPHPTKSLVAEVSPKTSPAEPHRSKPMPTPDTDRPATQPGTDQTSIAKPSRPMNNAVVPTTAPIQETASPASQEAKAPPSSPNPDTRLAEQGDAFAQYRLGRFYAQQGGPQAPESMRWYRKASDGLRRLAEAGNGQAMYVLGVMYAFGRGVKKDTEQARQWLTQADERKVTAARRVLASLGKPPTAAPGTQAFVSR